MLPMPPSTAKKIAACSVLCGSTGSKIGRSAPAICGICPATMIIPPIVHNAAIAAISREHEHSEDRPHSPNRSDVRKGIVEGLVEQVQRPLETAAFSRQRERENNR